MAPGRCTTGMHVYMHPRRFQGRHARWYWLLHCGRIHGIDLCCVGTRSLSGGRRLALHARGSVKYPGRGSHRSPPDIRPLGHKVLALAPAYLNGPGFRLPNRPTHSLLSFPLLPFRFVEAILPKHSFSHSPLSFLLVTPPRFFYRIPKGSAQCPHHAPNPAGLPQTRRKKKPKLHSIRKRFKGGAGTLLRDNSKRPFCDWALIFPYMVFLR